MGPVVLSNILMQNTWVLEKFAGFRFTFTCETTGESVVKFITFFNNLQNEVVKRVFIAQTHG